MKSLQKFTIAFLIGAQSLFAQTSKPFPKEAEALRVSYLRARTEALRPIDQKYENALEKLLTTYTRAGRLDDAITIRAELETLKKDEKIDSGETRPPAKFQDLLADTVWKSRDSNSFYSSFAFTKKGEIIRVVRKEINDKQPQPSPYVANESENTIYFTNVNGNKVVLSFSKDRQSLIYESTEFTRSN